MKLAWLCYQVKLAWFCYQNGWIMDEDEDEAPIILFEEPEEWCFRRVIPIVYAEVIK